MAYLFVLKGHNAKQSIKLDKDRILLGRNANCDFAMRTNDFTVSREHACILRVQGKFFIEDLGSRNGTYVNNQAVTERRQLIDNDRIRIGDYLLSFHLATAQPEIGARAAPAEVQVRAYEPVAVAGGLSTPDYLAPEQIDERPDRPVSPATDLHAVGVMMFHMLTGVLPFPASAQGFDKLQAIAKRRFVSAVTRCREAGIDSKLAPLIDDCLNGRYRRAEHLQWDIRWSLGKSPAESAAVLPSPPTSTEPSAGESFLVANFLFEDTVSEAYAATGLRSGARVTLRLLKPSFDSPSYTDLVRKLGAERPAPGQAVPAVILRRFLAGRARPLPVLPNAQLNVDSNLASDGCLCLVEEYLGNRTLWGAIESGELVGKELRIAGIVEQILVGLAYAHAHNCTHANLTPHCIFLGADDTVKIEGFGLHAKVEHLRLEEGGDSFGASTFNPDVRELLPRERLQLLLDITTQMASRAESLETLLPYAIDGLFHVFRQAERGFLILTEEEDPRRLVPRVVRTRRSEDAATARFNREFVQLCLDEAQAFLGDDAQPDERFSASRSIADLRIRSVMCAPLIGQRGMPFGAVVVDTQDRSRKFTKEDLQMLVAVSNQLALSLENAKLNEDRLARERLDRDLQLARQMQRTFLPAALPTLPGYEFFVSYEAAERVSGDLYDFIALPDGRLAVVVADIAGKGLPAALMMAKLSADLQYVILAERDPALALTSLNRRLLQHSAHDYFKMDYFITLVAVVLEPPSSRVVVANAGSIRPLFRRGVTGVVEVATPLDAVGLPLGIMDGTDYQSYAAEMLPGDCLLLFTDGMIELFNPSRQSFGQDRLIGTFREATGSASQIGEHLVQTVKRHAGSRRLQDDITLVCIRREGPVALGSQGTT